MSSSEAVTQSVVHLVIVSVGSNINPEQNLQSAREILSDEVQFMDEATIIKTEPDGYQHQPDFLNGAYLLGTQLSYNDFNQYLKEIEHRLGRVKGPIKSGPRCIDLDIIIWDGKVVHSDYIEQKHYVIQPVNELLKNNSILLLES